MQDSSDHYLASILSVKHGKMVHSFLKNLAEVSIVWDEIVVPEVSLSALNKTLTFSPKKINDYIDKNRDVVKSFIMVQFLNMLRGSTGDNIIKSVTNFKINKDYWFSADQIATHLKLTSFDTNDSKDDLLIGFRGNFCTGQKYKAYAQDCLTKGLSTTPTRLTQEDYEKSLENIRASIEEGKANIVVSISEDYINKLILNTVESGIWQSKLGKMQAQLGPEKVYVRMDENQEEINLFIDMVYTPEKLQALAVGRKNLRFPLALKALLKIVLKNGVPHFVLKLNYADISDETLLNGRLNIASTISKARFKKKILEDLRDKINGILNTEIVSIPLSNLSGVGLEETHFVSDGFGRMNVLLSLDKGRN
jgi:hypothetical protein